MNLITTKWFEKKTFVFAWIALFFPVGLYGLWQNQTDFDTQKKWMITVGCILALLILGDSIYFIFCLFSIMAYISWADQSIEDKTRWMLSGFFALLALLLLVLIITVPAGYESSYYDTMIDQSGNSTYSNTTINHSINGSYVGDGNCSYVTSPSGVSFKSCD